MNVYLAEFIGTVLLVLMGNGVVANVLLSRTKGHDAGWLVICAGWGLAVFTAVLCVGSVSGAHINPAVTIGVAIAGTFSWQLVPGYLIAQMLGGIGGAGLVYVIALRSDGGRGPETCHVLPGPKHSQVPREFVQ